MGSISQVDKGGRGDVTEGDPTLRPDQGLDALTDEVGRRGTLRGSKSREGTSVSPPRAPLKEVGGSPTVSGTGGSSSPKGRDVVDTSVGETEMSPSCPSPRYGSG